MSRRRSHVACTLLILLVMVTFTPAAWAAPLREARKTGSLFAYLWETLVAIWAPEGCGIDPHGNCTADKTPRVDEGCALDPHGNCAIDQEEAPAPKADEGCMIDPHGGCRSGS